LIVGELNLIARRFLQDSGTLQMVVMRWLGVLEEKAIVSLMQHGASGPERAEIEGNFQARHHSGQVASRSFPYRQLAVPDPRK
jgi:hypothetical protein